MTRKTSRPKAKTAKKQAVKTETLSDRTEAAAIEPIAAPSPEPDFRPGKTPKVTRSQIAAERIEDEYAYITGDLRRVFLLAAAMFALLIILNIVLGRIG